MALNEGYTSIIAFVIQMNQIREVTPEHSIDPVFADTFERITSEGVYIMYLGCTVREDLLVPDQNRITCLKDGCPVSFQELVN